MSQTAPAVHQGRIVPMIFREGSTSAVAAGEGPVNRLGFTAIVTVNGKDVPIKAENILDMATKGIEFDLIPPSGDPLTLGTLQNLIAWFADQMGFAQPDWNNLPAALRAITEVVASVDKLYVKANKDDVTFDIRVTLTFNWVLIKGLELKTFTFQLNREQQSDPPPQPDDHNG